MKYPYFDKKHRLPSVTRAKDFQRYWKSLGKMDDCPIPENMIMCYDEKLMDDVEKNYKTKEIRGFHGKLLAFQDNDYRTGINGNFGFGAPIAVVCLEELAAAGAKNVISIGMSGGLQPYLQPAEIVVCSGALRDEGTSHNYLENNPYAYPSPFLKLKLENALQKSEIKFTEGQSWTTDAPYRETRDEIEYYRSHFVLTVEMEAAALFAAGQFLKLEVASAFVISDLLDEKGWKMNFSDPRVDSRLRELFQCAREAFP